MLFQRNQLNLEMHDRFCGHNPIAIWAKRSALHKATYYKNVLAAFLCLEINHRSLWHGLRYPAYTVALAARPKLLGVSNGMIFMCPEVIEELEEMMAPHTDRIAIS